MTDVAPRTISECPFVSVVVPTHGRRALLERLLHSLLAQQWPADRFEIIVVHNYTPDGTDTLVAALAANSKVALHYHRTAFTRPGPSRQYGSERAQGSVLAFIDDDCQATPGWIAAGVAAWRQGLALIQGRTLPRPDQPRRLLEKTVTVTGPTAFFETCNIFYDTVAFRAVGGFPERFRVVRAGEDTSLGWTLRAAGYATGFAADALVYHEVFAVSYWDWLREVNIVTELPALAAAYPAMRQHLYLGVFLSRTTAAFDLFAIGLIGGAGLHPLLLLLCLPYCAVRMLERGRHRRPHILLARLLFGLPRAAAMAWVLLMGSLRARSPVL